MDGRDGRDEYEEYYIDCIGYDNKLHVCLPWENITKCGIKIRSKIIKDRARYFSCYECTY